MPEVLQPYFGGKNFLPFNEKKLAEYMKEREEEEAKAAAKAAKAAKKKAKQEAAKKE